jgi:hypothetical protein
MIRIIPFRNTILGLTSARDYISLSGLSQESWPLGCAVRVYKTKPAL